MNQNHEWEKLATESKVVAVGRPVKKPDAGLNPSIALNSTFHAGGPIGYARSAAVIPSALRLSPTIFVATDVGSISEESTRAIAVARAFARR